MAQDVLKICDLTVRYRPASGHSVLALNRVNLEVAPGEVVGILGESGSGKSTLSAAILQLLPASAEIGGTISFEGRGPLSLNCAELRNLRGSRISRIPQDPAVSLNPVLKIGTQISEVLRAHLTLNRKQRKNRVAELLLEVGFEDPERIASSYPQELSGGQCQRVVIAQAIASHPALIVADEPTSKLDPPLEMEILQLILEIKRSHGAAILWITHNPATLVDFADRIAMMHQGRIVEQGTLNDMFRRPSHAYTKQLAHSFQELLFDPIRKADHLKYAK